MIDFQRHILDNGLRVLVAPDASSPIATFNLQYMVGSRNERADRTGFAHLFEHLMFGGTPNVADFDKVLQKAGADNNAYTDDDITNYYITIPACNIETAFALDSDRMNMLSFSTESIETQRKVVIEEFKQRCLNQPYGDLMHLMRGLCYKVHPYRWPTIGLKPEHIAEATEAEIKEFFFNYYAPDNAVLAIAGDVDPDEMFRLAEKHFGGIRRRCKKGAIEQEIEQREKRVVSVERDVPVDIIQLCYHIDKFRSRTNKVLDAATDILADGPSSRLTQQLVRKERVFSEVDAVITDTLDPGLLVFTGVLLPETTMEAAESAIDRVVSRLIEEGATDYELQKARNRAEADKANCEMKTEQTARVLASLETAGGAEYINTELDEYMSIGKDEISETLARVTGEDKKCVLQYMSR